VAGAARGAAPGTVSGATTVPGAGATAVPGAGAGGGTGVRAGVTKGAGARPSVASYRVLIGDLAALTKPGITRLVVFTTAAGYLMATGMELDILRLLNTLVGAALAASGASALNMWWERESDAAMARTRRRPVPAGRVTPRQALTFAVALSVLGLVHLAAFVNIATLLLVATSLASYVLIYTPLKRRTHHATLIGAIPGALPALAGWTASGEPMGAAALAIFGVVFFWQMPHFYALAWVYRQDYGTGGLRMLSVIDPAGRRLGFESFAYSVALLAVSLVPVATGLIGWVYGVGATLLGLAMVVLSARLWAVRDDQRAWQLFFGSITYLPIILVLMLADRFLL
jgi:heme o synthase